MVASPTWPGTSSSSQSAAVAGTPPGQGQWWRNVHYGETENDKRLEVRKAPDANAELVARTLAFGDRFEAKDVHKADSNLWLKLEAGWVLAQSDVVKPVVNCVNVSDWQGFRGRIPEKATRGQKYPVGMFTEGFGGSSNIVVASASGDAFWREINLEMLCRDIGTMTLYEKGWEGDDLFQDWVAQYALNAAKYGAGKQFVVIVKPTCTWRRFSKGEKGVALDEIKQEIGRAQCKELNWIFRQRERLECSWEEIEFLTAFGFLQKYCTWSRPDCMRAANEKLNAFCCSFQTLDAVRCEEELNCTFWSWMEAFDNLPDEAKVEATLGHTLLQTLIQTPQRPPLAKRVEGECATGWTDLTSEVQSLAPEIYSKVARSPTWCLIEELKQREVRRSSGGSKDKRKAKELRFVISAGGDKVVQMWCPRTLAPLRRFEGHQDQVWSCCLSHDEKFLITTSNDRTAKLWSTDTGQCRFTYHHLPEQSSGRPAAAPNWACVTPDLRYLCTAVNDSTAKIFDVERGVLVKELRHAGGVNSVCLSPDGLYLFTGSGDRLGRMWRVPSGEPVRTFDGGHRQAVYSCSLGPNAEHFYTASFDGGTTMFDVASGDVIRRFNGPGEANNVCASATGRHVFVGRGESGKSRAQMFAVGTGDLVREFHGHDRDITAQWVSQDETYLCTSSLDGTARVWNVSSGTELARYDGHRGSFVQCVIGAA